MGINQFPKYELQFKEVSLNVADKYGLYKKELNEKGEPKDEYYKYVTV